MTGFSRADGECDGMAWTWEIKSVNGRGLDIRCRLPAGYDSIDAAARKLIGERLGRGNVSVNLQMARSAGESAIQVNWPLLETLIESSRRLEVEFGVPPARADGLLGLRGVLEPVSELEDEDMRARREAALLASLEIALEDLCAARAAEGDHLAQVVGGQLDDIEQLTGSASRCAATQPEAIRQRLGNLIKELLSGSELPEDRLAQEAALLATKADVREELDRLLAHVAACRELLNAGGSIGRKLDFLAQEFNREANTLCSKSQDTELTRIGIELKTVIDQLREQAQNIE